MEAILSMTKHGGPAMDLGQVAERFLADLVLVSGDPLSDPLVLLDHDNLIAVMKDGEFHKSPQLT